MTETVISGPDDADKAGGTLRRVVELVRTPAALALASLALGFLSLQVVAPAVEIGQLDGLSKTGLPLSDSTGLRVESGVRLALAVVALALAFAAVSKLGRSRPADAEAANWMSMVGGAAAIIGMVAVLLNAAAFADALGVSTNSPFGIYNHIGS